jgi:hypothetical protein
MGEVIGGEGHNSDGVNIDEEAVAKLIDEIEAEQAKIDKNNAETKELNAPHRDAIAGVKKKIREDHGMQAKALGTLLTKRRQERRMQERIANLDTPAREQFELFDAA